MTTSTQNWRRNDSEDRGANADFDVDFDDDDKKQSIQLKKANKSKAMIGSPLAR